MAVDDKHEQAGDRICTMAKIGLVEVRVSLVLNAVIAAPPDRILVMAPRVPRLEGEVMPPDHNLFADDLGVVDKTSSVVVDVVAAC